MRFERTWAMPSGETFSIPPISETVQRVCKNAKVIVDPFARNSKYGTLTNDLNPETTAEYHEDALEFLKTVKSDYADVVLFDPPYSITQAATLYKQYGADKLEVNVANMKYWKLCKDNIARILKVGGGMCVLRLELQRTGERQGV